MKCHNCGTELKGHAKFCPKCGAKVAMPFHHDISAVWPEWQLESLLGRGSYGTVYQAVRKNNTLVSHAAIKVISIPSDSSEVSSLRSEGLDADSARSYFYEIVTDFVEEIRLMEAFKGLPNIVSVEDYKVVEKRGEVGWDIYIRMELLTPFNNYICDKQLTEAEVIKLGCDICTALEICGQRKIIHRDIKPENIFINDFGYFKLGDFGIARRMENTTGGFSQKGTYNYMAPEVSTGNKYDARVDIYSLGIVLYRLLNHNRLPFLDTEKQLLNPNERKLALDRRLRGEALPVPVEASPSMAQLILKACAFDPDQRFASATEMRKALLAVAANAAQAEKAPEHTTPVRKAPTAEEKPVPAPVKPAAVPTADKTTSVRDVADSGKTAAVRKPEKAKQEHPAPKLKTKQPRAKGKGKGLIISLAAAAAVIVVAVVLFVGPLKTGLRTVDGQTYYYKLGDKQTGWQSVKNYQYYFDENGIMATGFRNIDGETYYFKENGHKTYNWLELNGKQYYFDDLDGKMLTGWQEIDGEKYYFDENGAMQIGWREIDSKTYYFDDNGIMLTGEHTIDGKQYFFGSMGPMMSALQRSSSKQIDSTNTFQNGWCEIDGKTFYSKDGKTQLGFQHINGNTYYFDKINGMATGWLEIEQSWVADADRRYTKAKRTYYFSETGIMQTGQQVIDGKTYHFDNNGVLID